MTNACAAAVLEDSLTLKSEGHQARRQEARSSFVLPAAMTGSFAACGSDLELLEVALPAAFRTLL